MRERNMRTRFGERFVSFRAMASNVAWRARALRISASGSPVLCGCCCEIDEEERGSDSPERCSSCGWGTEGRRVVTDSTSNA